MQVQILFTKIDNLYQLFTYNKNGYNAHIYIKYVKTDILHHSQ